MLDRNDILEIKTNYIELQVQNFACAIQNKEAANVPFSLKHGSMKLLRYILQANKGTTSRTLFMLVEGKENQQNSLYTELSFWVLIEAAEV